MFRREFRSLLLLAYLVALEFAILGCQGSSHSRVAADARPAAEKSFDEIAYIMKGALETGGGGIPTSIVSDDASIRTQFSIHNEVTSQLIPPATADDIYRAKITVTSKTSYSMRKVTDSDRKSSDKDKQKDNGQDSKSNPLTEDTSSSSKGTSGSDTRDESVAATAKTRAMPAKPEDAVQREQNEDVHTYDLAYENNRWVLKTELDPKTEQAVSNAFNHALSSQP